MVKTFKKFFENVKTYFKSNTRQAVLIFFILEFIIGFFVVGFTRYDGEYFIKKSTEMSLWDFTVMRYQTWSSRNIIEYLSCIVLRWSTRIMGFCKCSY